MVHTDVEEAARLQMRSMLYLHRWRLPRLGRAAPTFAKPCDDLMLFLFLYLSFSLFLPLELHEVDKSMNNTNIHSRQHPIEMK